MDLRSRGHYHARDLVALAENWLSTSGVDYTKGDFNYDGVVDQHDLTILAQNWQVSLASLAPASAPPPQPTAGARPPTRPLLRNGSTPVINLVTETLPAPTSSSRTASRTPVRNVLA